MRSWSGDRRGGGGRQHRGNSAAADVGSLIRKADATRARVKRLRVVVPYASLKARSPRAKKRGEEEGTERKDEKDEWVCAVIEEKT